MKNISLYVTFFLICILLISCNNNKNELSQQKNKDKFDLKSSLENANKYLNKVEEIEINDYIKRYDWQMNETPTGLRYMIYYKSKSNIKPEKGSIVKINYTLSLINGVVCYTSDSTGPKTFELGKAQVERGLEEGIKFLNVGDKAKLIIPSYLAYGLPGDLNKIPKRATLIYDVELLEVKKTKNISKH
ncbi:MAG TPA: FKBP-type peptidyl-prolyl cis-trans isomerase [Bacteroidales bacterium]|nr:FKBP-type peptidyl-prolyl cis-trans isomerase [Bacteroidales bacterium]